MQLYAHDLSGELIFSCRAKRRENYTCLECGSLVRLRDGPLRHPHFFHLQKQSQCRQNGKSEEHLKVQLFLQNLLPELELECRFPTISRIADAAWHTKKIIFEIQCSFLSEEELKARNADYQSLGYQVVWILHDSRFNQWRKSPLEHALQTSPYFYTNMDKEGRGFIYDQWHFFEKGLRKKSLSKIGVNLAIPLFLEETLTFSGAIATLPPEHPYLIKIQKLTKTLSPRKKTFWDHVLLFYQQMMLKILKGYAD